MRLDPSHDILPPTHSACLTCTAAACRSAAGWVASQAGLPLEQWVPATAKQSFTTAVIPCEGATMRCWAGYEQQAHCLPGGPERT